VKRLENGIDSWVTLSEKRIVIMRHSGTFYQLSRQKAETTDSNRHPDGAPRGLIGRILPVAFHEYCHPTQRHFCNISGSFEFIGAKIGPEVAILTNFLVLRPHLEPFITGPDPDCGTKTYFAIICKQVPPFFVHHHDSDPPTAFAELQWTPHKMKCQINPCLNLAPQEWSVDGKLNDLV